MNLSPPKRPSCPDCSWTRSVVFCRPVHKVLPGLSWLFYFTCPRCGRRGIPFHGQNGNPEFPQDYMESLDAIAVTGILWDQRYGAAFIQFVMVERLSLKHLTVL